MKTGIKRIADILLKLYSVVGLIFLGIVIVTTFLQVTTRYFFEASFSWTEEAARYAFIWMSMMGASLAARHGSNAAIDLTGDMLCGSGKYFHQIIIQGSIIFVSLLIGYYGIQMISVMMVRSSAALGIPMGYVYCAIPIGCLGMIIQCGANVTELFENRGGEVKE